MRFVSPFVIVRFLPEFHIRCVLAFMYTLPFSMIRATTGQSLGLNVIAELIIGYALPGHPIAMMMFQTWGYMTMDRAITFMRDFKLAHYMKISHRPMFFCQVIGTIVASTVQLGVQDGCSPTLRAFAMPIKKMVSVAHKPLRSVTYQLL